MKQFKKINQSGFTLIEIIIVMVLIGILVAVAVPKFEQFKSKAKLTTIQNDSKVLSNIVSLDAASKAKDFFGNGVVCKTQLEENIYKNGEPIDLNSINKNLYLIENDYVLSTTSSKLINEGSFYTDAEFDIYYSSNISID